MTMTRDVQEAICRCHLALDNAHDAALPARQLVSNVLFNTVAKLVKHSTSLAPFFGVYIHKINISD